MSHLLDEYGYPPRYTQADWDLLREGEDLLRQFEILQGKSMKQLRSKHNGVLFAYCEAMEATGDYEVVEPPKPKKTRRRRTKKPVEAEPANVELPDQRCD